MTIHFELNDKPVELMADGDRTLLWVLRLDLGLTGTKYGCGSGFCGACTILVEGEPVRACQLTANDIQGKQVMTIEGLARNGDLHPLQEAFIEHGALQCGYCTSGMIVQAYDLLQKNPMPTRQQIIQGMDENLCRCGAHVRIIQAIETASATSAGGNQR